MNRAGSVLGIAGFFLLSFLILPQQGIAEDYYCEVMTLEGSATFTSGGVSKALKPGDLLKAGDVVEVQKGHLDLAYDKEWNNVTRVWEKSKVKIHSIYPTGLRLDEGVIFAKLHKLPKGSTFEIQTPTAIAAVRGSEYMTEYRGGITRVFNYSSSPVEVFSLDATGNLLERAIVKESEKTEILRVSESPRQPEKMSGEEIRRVGEYSAGIDRSVRQTLGEGRVGRTQEVGNIEKMKTMSSEDAQKMTEKMKGKDSEETQKMGERMKTVDPDKTHHLESRMANVQKNTEKTVDRNLERTMNRIDRDVTEAEKRLREEWCKTHNC